MIVLDASAAIELVLRTPRAERIAERALDPKERLNAPHLIDIEVVQVLRRLSQAREISAARAQAALVNGGQEPPDSGDGCGFELSG